MEVPETEVTQAFETNNEDVIDSELDQSQQLSDLLFTQLLTSALVRSTTDNVNVNGNGNGDPSSSTGANVPAPSDSNAFGLRDYVDENEYRPLYLAALRGDWEEARRFLEEHPEARTATVSPFSRTALHVAAGEGHSEFVEKMVELLSANELERVDEFGSTALHLSAFAGISPKAAKAMIKKNPNLTNIMEDSGRGRSPLLIAAYHGSERKDLVWYLSLVTKDEGESSPFTGPFAGDLVLALTAAGHLDILLCLLQIYPELATATTKDRVSLLGILAETPSNFLSGSGLGFWERLIYSIVPLQRSCGPPNYITSIAQDFPKGSQNLSKILSAASTVQHEKPDIVLLPWLRRLLLNAIKRLKPHIMKRLQDEKLRHHCAVTLAKHACNKIRKERGSMFLNGSGEYGILYDAAMFGIIEMVKILLQSCPDLIWAPIGGRFDKALIHIAIENRQESIFEIFCDRKSTYKIVTSNGTILHLVAKLAPLQQLSSVSGAALQMQRELQWFKAVSKLVHPSLINHVDLQMRTAQELFTNEHKQLAEAGEKWMKDTSNSCMIVSTLIATFVFAAAFTVPGGTDNEGVPNYLWTKSFLLFAISDSLALFSSVTSLLMFFSILTARYAEEDFYRSLPKKLMIGLAALFFSIATMMVAFGATLYIVLSERFKWVSIPITLLASFPVTIFVLLQFPLFIQMFRSTFVKSIFHPQSPWS